MTTLSVPPAFAPRPLGLRPAAAQVIEVSKRYGRGDSEVRALDDVSVTFATGELTAIMGPSGSGKSTLMHCVAGLDTPTSGRIMIGDTDLLALSDRELTQLRRDRIGFIFQAFNLIPTLTAAGEAGREITRTNGCAACHGRNGEGSAGPAFVGLFGSTVEFKDGTTAVADADYLYESITDPAARLVEGYGFPMPPNDLSDEQVESVITYIEELADAADGS